MSISVADATLIATHAALSALPNLSLNTLDTDDDVLSIEATYGEGAKTVTETITFEVDVMDQQTARFRLYVESVDASIAEWSETKADDSPYFTVDTQVVTDVIKDHMRRLHANTYASIIERVDVSTHLNYPHVILDEEHMRLDIDENFCLIARIDHQRLDVIGADGSTRTLLDVAETYPEHSHEDASVIADGYAKTLERTIDALNYVRDIIPLVQNIALYGGATAPAEPVAPEQVVTTTEAPEWAAPVIEEASPWDDEPTADTTEPNQPSLGEGWIQGEDGGYIFVGQ